MYPYFRIHYWSTFELESNGLPGHNLRRGERSREQFWGVTSGQGKHRNCLILTTVNRETGQKDPQCLGLTLAALDSIEMQKMEG